jgi:hypothetical protein
VRIKASACLRLVPAFPLFHEIPGIILRPEIELMMPNRRELKVLCSPGAYEYPSVRFEGTVAG